MNRTTNLTANDLETFGRLGIDYDLVLRAGLRRVTDLEARQVGFTGSGDNNGVLIPYLDAEGVPRTYRLRRDHPEIEDGKIVRKYVTPYGDRRHLYVVPGDHALGHDPSIPVVIVEAEKSALALRAFADRNGRRLLPIATGGCWGWRGRIGKLENSKGERVDEMCPLPELGICRDGRKVYVLLDANCSSNSKVRAARNALVRQLLKQKAKVHVLDLPVLDGVNDPDDYIALCGDEGMGKVFDSPPSNATNWRRLLVCRETRRGPIPERILANVLTTFRNAPDWDEVLSFNEFSQQVMTQNPTPWGKPAGMPWTDNDDSLSAAGCSGKQASSLRLRSWRRGYRH